MNIVNEANIPQEADIKLPHVNFMTVDGVVYPLGEGVKFDVAEGLKGYFIDLVNTEINNLKATLVRDSDEEFNKQVKRIRDLQRSAVSDIRLPSNMTNRNIFYHSTYREFILTRTVIYSPTEIKGRVQEFEDLLHWDLRANESVAPFDRRKNYYVAIKCPWSIPITFGYSVNAQKIIITSGTRTFHALSDLTICTGTWKSALSLWNLPDGAFAAEVNRVNLFSLATGILQYNGNDFVLRSMLLADKSNVISITEEAAWKV